jgi:hypothetical protein
MIDHSELVEFIKWTMKYYGSDAQEKTEPGSRLKAQAEHIAEFVYQREEALRRLHDLHLVTVKWATGGKQ